MQDSATTVQPLNIHIVLKGDMSIVPLLSLVPFPDKFNCFSIMTFLLQCIESPNRTLHFSLTFSRTFAYSIFKFDRSSLSLPFSPQPIPASKVNIAHTKITVSQLAIFSQHASHHHARLLTGFHHYCRCRRWQEDLQRVPQPYPGLP